MDWRIPPEAEDWECDWESSRRFQINYWASLPFRDQMLAVEELGCLAELLQTPEAAAGENPPTAEPSPTDSLDL